jgi:hypothetical protein
MNPDELDGPCYYCGRETSSIAGNPSKWPIWLPHEDEPGVSKPHHMSCILERVHLGDNLFKLEAAGPYTIQRCIEKRNPSDEYFVSVTQNGKQINHFGPDLSVVVKELLEKQNAK